MAVSPIIDTLEAKTTAALIEDCFELRNTAIRTQECHTKVRALQRTMTVFYRELDRYNSDKTEKSKRAIKGMLDRSYKFAGFTRTYLRNRIEQYPELAQYVAL